MGDDDPRLAEALRRHARAYQPDHDRIRARFEAGTRAKRAATHQRSRPRLVFARLAPAGLAVAAVVGFYQAATLVTDNGSVVVDAGGTSAADSASSSGPANPTTQAGQIGTAASIEATEPVTTSTQPPTGSAASSSVPARVTSPPPSTSPPSLTPQPTPVATPVCDDGASVVLAPYYVTNNLWGADSGTGAQCVSASRVDGSAISWSTIWSWTGEPDQVKSFSNAVLGWHWGWQLPDTGLPVKVDDQGSIPTSWDFELVEQTGSHEVFYDLWFHDQSDPTWSDAPSAEVRIVLYQSTPYRPTTGKVGFVRLDGSSWDVYEGENNWDVVTFYRNDPGMGAELDLKKFIDIADRSTQLTYLSSIGAGITVTEGTGRLDTSSYSVTIE